MVMIMTRLQHNGHDGRVRHVCRALLTAPILALPLCFSSHTTGVSRAFVNELYADVAGIADSLLAVTIPPTSRIRAFETFVRERGPETVDIHAYLDVLFRYRDRSLLPLYKRILATDGIAPYFKAQAIMVLGEIDPPFTFQNGGYRSHVHLGIEKAAYSDAIVAGYHPDIERWYDPVAFIGSRCSAQ